MKDTDKNKTEAKLPPRPARYPEQVANGQVIRRAAEATKYGKGRK